MEFIIAEGIISLAGFVAGSSLWSVAFICTDDILGRWVAFAFGFLFICGSLFGMAITIRMARGKR